MFEVCHSVVYGKLFIVLVPSLHIKTNELLQLVTFGYMFRLYEAIIRLCIAA